MDAETIGAVIARVHGIESDVGALRRTIDAEQLSVSDRQYVSRCFDLLTMELDALRQYLRGLTAP
ncbi:MAG TPA: hypothetical protein VG106_10670 [Vicinamibacterales bacterium]|nr:hypothetical protein [Vicinamibacterales bacterium]